MSEYELVHRPQNAGRMQSIDEFKRISMLGRGGFANVSIVG